jgi:hypothetical protein
MKSLTDRITFDIIRNDDGYYVYWPLVLRGYYTSEMLRMIADHLDSHNAEWDATVKGDMNEG